MTTINTNRVQIGLSDNPNYNFTMIRNVPTDGTLKIHRGCIDKNGVDQIGQEVLRIDANNEITFPKNEYALDFKLATLINGWVPYNGGYGPPSYARDQFGTVYLSGLISMGTAVNGATMFVLPPGYRPGGRELQLSLTNNLVARVDIAATGEVIPTLIPASGWVGISGMSFRAVN